jgi:sigma-E factor negative regulatory protein RseB
MRLCFHGIKGSDKRCLLTFWVVSSSLLAHASGETVGRDAPSCSSVDACLRRIVRAPQRLNFEGTFVVDGASHGASLRIVHYGDGRSQLERVERLDGPERIVYRRDDDIVVLQPAERTLSYDARRFTRPFPFVGHAGNERVANYYSLTMLGSARVAGRSAEVIGLMPKDGLRYAYRLWLDRSTGLPLRAEIVGAQQQVLEWAAFSDISMGIKAEPQRVLQGMKQPEGWTIRQPVFADADIAYEGWFLHDLPAGFELIRAIKRQCVVDGASPAQPTQAGGLPMLQLVFSDGLTHVSLFIEPFEAHAQRRNMVVSMGATQTAMIRRDGWWFTAMGDVPVASLKAFLAAVERRN